MTVDLDDEQDGDVLSRLSSLQRYDVSRSRASQLRRRCHAMLRKEPPAKRSAPKMDRASLRRVALPALGVVWCLAYLAEIIRSTVAIHTYFGTR